MNYTNINNLSMTGGDDFSDINLILANVVLTDTTQTITGDKLISGTTTFTGDIVANGFTITPTELGYIDGLTSNAQAQINLKANDADVVHLTGNETIAGEKRFVDDVLIKPTGNTTDTQLKITGNYNAVDFKKSLAVFSNISSGGSNDYGGYIGSDRQNFGNFLIGRYHNNAIVGGVFDPAIRIDWTDYDTNTADIKIFQPITSTIGGLERLTVSSTNDTVINNDRVYIKNGGNTRIEVNDNGDTTLNNTTNIILKSNGITKYFNSPTANTHINDAHYIRNTTNTITYASFDGANNIISNVDNQLTASGTNTLSAVNNTITATSGTNTINGATAITGTTTITGNIVANSLTITPTELGYIDGLTSNAQTQITARALDSAVVHKTGGLTESIDGDKTFSGTTTFTGNITANALTITPTELGYIDGLTSNAQTQITARALDSEVVHKEGTETINGEKTFTGVTTLAYRTSTNNIQFANANIGLGKSFIDLCSGGNSDYDVRIQSDGGTGTVANGAITIEAGTTTLDTKTTNTIKSGGSAKITTTTGINTLQNDTNYIVSTAGVYNWSSNGGSATINATGAVNLQLSNVPKLVFSSTTGTTLYGDSKIAYVDANLNIQPKSQTGISYLNFCSGGNDNYDTRLRSDGGTATTAKGYLSVEAQQFIAPHYWVGYYGGSTQLMSGCIYANQSTTSLSGGGSVPMSIGGFARTTYSIQQGILPVNARFYACVFMSDNANQTTARTITLEMTGVNRFSCACPTGTAYQSILGTALTGGGYWDLSANNGYYLQIKTSGTSTNAKDWNVMLFWQQI